MSATMSMSNRFACLFREIPCMATGHGCHQVTFNDICIIMVTYKKYINLSIFLSKDWVDGASTTDCGRLFHTSVHQCTKEYFVMFNLHLFCIFLGYVLLCQNHCLSV